MEVDHGERAEWPGDAMSIFDVKQRIEDGLHSTIVFVMACALLVLVLVLRAIGVVSNSTTLITVIVMSAIIILNIGFYVRLLLVGDAEKRQSDAIERLTPHTGASVELSNMSYDELVRHTKDTQSDHRDT